MFLNEWAYNPPGEAEGFLFYTLWGAHIAASAYSNQDAHGPVRRGLILTTCRSLGCSRTWSRPTASSPPSSS